MKVLVTGASSLLARRTVESLLARGHEVVVFQRGAAGIDTAEVLGDIRDPDAVRRAAVGCDAVIHAAAKVGVSGPWDEYRAVNLEGTANVLAAVRQHGIGRLVHVSTPSVAHAGHSLIGAAAGPAVTGRSRAWYAESKALAERLVLERAAETPVVAIRPHLVWGPGDTQLVGRIVDRARRGRLALVGDGAALVDTTYVDNAADALGAALDALTPGAPCVGRAYVIANGEPRPIRELIEGICRAAGLDVAPKHLPVRLALGVGTLTERLWGPLGRSGEPPMTRFLAEQLGTAHWFDPRPARRDLGWTPAVSIDTGLARLADWFSQGAPA